MITISELTIPAINAALLRIQQGSNSSQPAGTQQVINNVVYKTENSSTVDLTDVNNKIKINSDSITALSGLLNEVISKCSSIDVTEENGEITFFNYEGFDFTINLNDLFTLSASETDKTITLTSKDGTTSTITVPYATNALNDNNGDQIDTTYQKIADKGIANGYVPLNEETKIDKEYIPPVSEEDFTSEQWAAINSGITADMIPDQASASNELADKNFVNSSIATNTANFIDTFNSLAELEAYSGTKTNNDYAFVKATDSAGNVVYKRYKWSSTDNEWKYEYDLNNSSFTAEQWEAINSGISSALKTKLDGIASGAEVNVQSDWNTTDTNADSYIKNKPTIPSVDGKMDKANPTGTGSFSMNRKADTTIGSSSSTLGMDNTASGYYSHAEGYSTTASNYQSHTEGLLTTASGTSSHAEGDSTTASNWAAHAEGYNTTASGYYTHAEGDSTTASGQASHAEGVSNVVSISAAYSHVEGGYNEVKGAFQHVAGKFSVPDTTSTRITGWGDSDTDRKNIERLDTDGTLHLKGDVYVKCNDDSSGGTKLSTFSGSYNDLSNKPTIPTVPTDIVKYSAQTLTDTQKSQARSNIGAGTYSKPSDGIPKSDLASAVQTSLGKADTALQSAPVTSVAGKTGAVTLAKGDVGLGNVVNTGDSATPVSGGTTKFTTGGAYTELAKKLDKTAKASSASTADSATSATDALYYGTCDTSRATNAKVITCSTFALKTGARIVVKFTDTAGSAPTSGNITFNINSTGAKNVYNKNGSQVTYASSGEFRANRYCLIAYDGTNYVWLNYDSNTTYSTITQAEIDAGTSTSSRLVTPKLLNDNFAKKSDVPSSITVENNLTSTSATNALSANMGKSLNDNKQAKVAKLGSTTKPVYTSAAGTFSECSTYAGGTNVTLNGTAKGGGDASLYAPTSSGMTGQFLIAHNNSEPTWETVTKIEPLWTGSSGTGTLTLDRPIWEEVTGAGAKYYAQNYNFLIALASMYTAAGQIISCVMPVDEIIANTNRSYCMNGSLTSGAERRCIFKIPSANTLKVETMEGTSGNVGKFIALYGVKIKA